MSTEKDLTNLKWVCSEVLRIKEDYSKATQLAESLWREKFCTRQLKIPTSFKSFFHQLERMSFEDHAFDELWYLYEEETHVVVVGVKQGNQDYIFRMRKDLVEAI